ncbi:hypothetical protein LIER_03041 [Lithospermum erythrorhizon]|uniref:Uncharacterized protein n=1 Tax=Lithospermum erythrorhizon TaxID=34254 RepID=A0AAV3NVM1_LITER
MANNRNNPQWPPALPENDYYTFNSSPPLPPLVIFTERTNPWNPLFVRGLLEFTYLERPNVLSPRLRAPRPRGDFLQYPVLYPNLNLPPDIMSLRPPGPIELLRPAPRTLHPIVESPPRQPVEPPVEPPVPPVELPLDPLVPPVPMIEPPVPPVELPLDPLVPPVPMEEDLNFQTGLKRSRDDDEASSSGTKQRRNERDSS